MKPLTIEDLSRIVFVSNPAINPEGGLVAYVATRADVEGNTYRSQVWIAGEEGYRPLTGGPRDLCPSWSPDGRLLAFARREEKGGAGIYVVSPEGGEPALLEKSRWGAGKLSWSPRGDGIAFLARAPLDEGKWKHYNEREALEIDRIPVWFNGEGWVFDRFQGLFIARYPGGGVERVIHRKGVNVVDYDWSPDGGMMAVALSDNMVEPYRMKLVVVNLDTMEEQVLLEGMSIAEVAWGSRGDVIAVKARPVQERGFAEHFRVYTVDLSGEVSCVTCDLERNTMNLVNSDSRGPSCLKALAWPEDGRIYFPVSDAGRVHLYRVVPEGEVEEVIAPEAAVVDEFSVSRDGREVAFTLMTATRPNEVYLKREGEESRLTGHNDWMETRIVREPVHYQVESPHGGSIDVWILPPAREPDCRGCVPWILYIHGGPKTSYGYGFIHEFHVLSGMGFAIVYSNPRGSDGYSEEFADIRGRYGDLDYDELMKVADEAPSLYPKLDPYRAGVTGGSYGGYMTNTIVTRTSRFKAAVTQRSCSNWVSFYGESDIGWYFARDILQAPHPWESLEAYERHSPLFRAGSIETPLLIIHALEDYRCPPGEALQLFTALKVQGKDAKLVLFPGENHDLSRSGRPKQRMKRLREITGWFKEKLGLGEAGGKDQR